VTTDAEVRDRNLKMLCSCFKDGGRGQKLRITGGLWNPVEKGKGFSLEL
jgi:hypothetical protein